MSAVPERPSEFPTPLPAVPGAPVSASGAMSGSMAAPMGGSSPSPGAATSPPCGPGTAVVSELSAEPATEPVADAVAEEALDELAALSEAPLWRRLPWLIGGALSLLLGVIGIFLPLLPTTPFVLLAAFCFARGSARCEAWIVHHPRFGPMVRQWRASRAVPLRAKQAAWTMMTVSSVISALVMPVLPWLPAVCCLAVGVWLWRLPTAPRRATSSGSLECAAQQLNRREDAGL